MLISMPLDEVLTKHTNRTLGAPQLTSVFTVLINLFYFLPAQTWFQILALFQPGSIHQGHSMTGRSETAVKSLFPQTLSGARTFQPHKLFPNCMTDSGTEFQDPSGRILASHVSQQRQPVGPLLISLARLYSAWLKGRGQGSPEPLCLTVDPI